MLRSNETFKVSLTVTLGGSMIFHKGPASEGVEHSSRGRGVRHSKSVPGVLSAEKEQAGETRKQGDRSHPSGGGVEEACW